jgi:hypothetical protein
VIKITTKGSTKNTQSFLKSMKNLDIRSFCEAAGERGVLALRSATPLDSGLTAASWSYEVRVEGDRTIITWLNTNTESGVNVAIILQYGHGTGTGGWVAGRDYINPAIKPIFDSISDDVWKKVTSA